MTHQAQQRVLTMVSRSLDHMTDMHPTIWAYHLRHINAEYSRGKSTEGTLPKNREKEKNTIHADSE